VEIFGLKYFVKSFRKYLTKIHYVKFT